MGLTIPAGSSLNHYQELLTIDGVSPWEVLQAGGIGGEVTETRCLWTANNNVRQLDIVEKNAKLNSRQIKLFKTTHYVIIADNDPSLEWSLSAIMTE